MSTRATVHFQQGGQTEAIVYRHGDGYPDGLGKDLEGFLDELVAKVEDTRFDDPPYLAAKWIVWDAIKYGNRGGNFLNFLGVGIVLTDPGDIEYRYLVECDTADRPTIKVEQVTT